MPLFLILMPSIISQIEFLFKGIDDRCFHLELRFSNIFKSLLNFYFQNYLNQGIQEWLK